MTLSRAQLDQRAVAHRSHGAFSASEIGRAQRKWYARLLWRVRRATGRTSLRTRLAIEKVAYYRARSDIADAWLAQQGHPLFSNVATGAMWPIIAKLDEWASAEARYLAQLPAGAALEAGPDLATALARDRRSLRRGTRR